MAEETELSKAFPYSVKLESTAKGYRVHVHVYTTNADDARDQSVKLLSGTIMELEAKKFVVAPMEGRA